MDPKRPLALKLKINSGSDCAVAVVGEQLGNQNVLGIRMVGLKEERPAPDHGREVSRRDP